MPVRHAWQALAAYIVLSLAVTWPLALGLGRDVAWDLGDSVLNMWILAWDGEQIRRALTGDLSRLAAFFDANVFHPAPRALAYSEHLIPQAIQILPVYLITGNPILCYNLLFLSTFVLSGLGMYLLVRELTGSPAAAFVAGLVFAFAPYRVPQSSHVQVLSSQWMPFVFYGLTRYVRSVAPPRLDAEVEGSARPAGRLRPLAGAAVALAAQGLSTGYYLFFFTPFAVGFALWEIGRARLWRDRRTWVALSCAGLLVAAVTVPFLLPYAALRTQGYASRSLAEVTLFSADVYSYATAFADQRIWGAILQVYPKSEGELFPGLVPVLLALIGVFLYGLRMNPRSDPRSPIPDPRSPSWLAWLLAATAIGHGVAALLTIALRRVTLDTGLFVVRMGNIDRMLLRAAVALALLLVVSPTARMRLGAFMRDRGFFVLGLVAAAWLSLGPEPQSLGRPIELAAPYRLLYDHVPGFDGLRVPARFAMIGIFMLAVLAGYGAAVLARFRPGRRALVVLAAAFLLESTHVPFVVNGMTPLLDFNTPEARLYRPSRAPAIYHEMARQATASVVVELPLGQPDFDLRAMYYSTVHWRPVVNGYSGIFPPHYGRLIPALSEIPRHADVSLQALRATGATHVILHEAAYRGSEGAETAAVLRNAGAVELFRDGGDVLLRLGRE